MKISSQSAHPKMMGAYRKHDQLFSIRFSSDETTNSWIKGRQLNEDNFSIRAPKNSGGLQEACFR